MKKDPLWVLFHILGSQISFTEGEARRASREVSEAKPKPAQPQNLPMIERSEIEWRILRYIEDVARRVRAARRSRIAARTQNPARAKRTQPDFGLDLSEAQASPKGKTRKEMSVLAIWLPLTETALDRKLPLLDSSAFGRLLKQKSPQH